MRGHHQSPCQVQLSSDIPGRISVTHRLQVGCRRCDRLIYDDRPFCWLSTQVYTPFGRARVAIKFFWFFLKSRACTYARSFVKCAKRREISVL